MGAPGLGSTGSEASKKRPRPSMGAPGLGTLSRTAPGAPLESPRQSQEAPRRSQKAPGEFWRPRRAPQDGPDGPSMAQCRPKAANRRPKRPPRDPKRAPRGLPGEPQAAKIVDFYWFLRGFWAFQFFLTFSSFQRSTTARKTLQTARRQPKRPPQERPNTTDESLYIVQRPPETHHRTAPRRSKMPEEVSGGLEEPPKTSR